VLNRIRVWKAVFCYHSWTVMNKDVNSAGAYAWGWWGCQNTDLSWGGVRTPPQLRSSLVFHSTQYWKFLPALEYTKYVFGRGPGTYSAPPDPLAGLRGPTSKGREGKGGRGKGREEMEGKGRGGERKVQTPPPSIPAYAPVTQTRHLYIAYTEWNAPFGVVWR